MSETTTTSSTNPRVDRLTLVQQLGNGSIGTVAKAKSPKYESFVALRQFQVPEWLDDAEELIKRLLADARAANALNHPAIAKLHTGGFKGFTVFLTSEFIEGPAIKQYLSSRPFDLNEVVELGRQLCLALDYAYEKGVVHQCLTPANLKVTADGKLKILDFGLTRHKDIYSPIPAKRLENEHYLSPEQVKSKPADRASNLFTAGAILYELLTTRHPFAGKHLGEVDKSICEVDPQPPSALNSRLPESVSRIVLRALCKNPRERMQTGKEMAEALSEALATSSGSIPAVVPNATASPSSPSITTSQKIRAVAASAAASSSTAPAPPPVAAVPASAPISPAPAVLPSPTASSAGIKAAPSASSTATRPPAPVKVEKAAQKTSKMPSKLLNQWKLAGALVLLLFVVSALAISLRLRTKAPPPEPAVETTAAPVQPPSTPQDSLTVTPISTESPAAAPRRNREKVTNSEPVAAAPAAPTTGELSITSAPPGATIEIAGKTETWQTPHAMTALVPGSYKVTISKAGYASETRSIEVSAGNRASLDVRLAANKGFLTVTGTPTGASILIDGKDSGKLTPSNFVLDPATHTVTLHKDGYLDSTADIKLAAAQSVSYAPTLKLAGRTDNIKVVGGGIKRLFGGGGGSHNGMANVEFKTDPKGAQVTINGKTLDKTTPFVIEVEPGDFEITIQKSGYKPVHTNLAAGANEKVKIEEKLQQQ
ncbi:MAG TPA: PEGA domain-containing protein [Candidatus Angelobacter sp.]|nr:PEGA domain-containing protein [Candidatus Angelobacter sp.]